MYTWHRPTADEEARGIVAYYVKRNGVMPDDVQPCPYYAHHMERRVQRWRDDKSVDLPYWIEPLPLVQRLDKCLHVAIVGSRNYPQQQHIIDYVRALPSDSVIVSGGARGVDTWAEEEAKALGMGTLIYPADWATYGKSAGFRRNADIVNACDRLVAFWVQGSKGTKHSIDLAIKAQKQVEIITPRTVDIFDLPQEYFEYARAS